MTTGAVDTAGATDRLDTGRAPAIVLIGISIAFLTFILIIPVVS